jgi:hypothetical protein
MKEQISTVRGMGRGRSTNPAIPTNPKETP